MAQICHQKTKTSEQITRQRVDLKICLSIKQKQLITLDIIITSLSGRSFRHTAAGI